MTTALPYHVGQVPLGGGGVTRDIDIVSDGSNAYLVHIGDGQICLRLYPTDTQWVNINTSFSMPGTVSAPNSVWAIRIAPSDPTRLYCYASFGFSATNGFTYVSSNSGTTWTQTNFPEGGQALFGGVNINNYKFFRHTMAIDPANPNVVYLYIGTVDGTGSPNGAFVYRSFDAGTTVEKIGDSSGVAITTSLTGGNGVGAGMQFDPSSGTTGGKTNRLIIPTMGVGVWETTDAGSTFANIAGNGTTGPVGNVPCADMTQDGIYICYDTASPMLDGSNAGKLWRRNANNTWTELKDGGSSITNCFCISCNPLTNGTILIPATNSFFRVSIDYGDNWTSRSSNSGITVDTTGDSAQLSSVGAPVSCRYDAKTNGKVWMCDGLGVLYADSIDLTTAPMTVHRKSAGNEELVLRDMIAPYGSTNVIFGVDDRNVVTVFDVTEYIPGLATTTVSNPTHNISHGSALDWASSSPSTCIVCGVGASYTNDAGTTWAAFPSNDPWACTAGNTQFTTNINMISGQSFSAVIRTYFPGENPAEYSIGPVSFTTDEATTLTAIASAIVAAIPAVSCTAIARGLRLTCPGVAMFVSGTVSGSAPLPAVSVSGGLLITGTLAAATPLNWVVMASMPGIPFYTKDGGVTWKRCAMPTQIVFSSAMVSGQSFSGTIDGNNFGPVSFTTSASNTATLIASAINGVNTQYGAVVVDSTHIALYPPVGQQSLNPKLTNLVVTGGTPPTVTQQEFGSWVDGDTKTRHIVCADRVNFGTFYIYCWQVGLFRTTDGGDTWSRIHDFSSPPFNLTSAADFWRSRIRAHPYRAGELLFSPGTGFTPGLYRSTDGGVTWSLVTNTSQSEYVDWGRPTVVGNPATIWHVGKYNGVYGIWRSFDDGASFSNIINGTTLDSSTSKQGLLSASSSFAADLNDHNRYYYGFANGAFVGYVNNKWRLSATA